MDCFRTVWTYMWGDGLCRIIRSVEQSFFWTPLFDDMASVMARDNINEKYAAQILGHASPATTKRIYTHVMGDKVVQINDMLDAHASKVLNV